jgi:hypothetical protein
MRTITEQELKEILDKHGKWLRNEDGGERADLSFADLHSANLSFANLSFANLRSADLSSTNLSSTNLNSANLSFANLSSADLSFANLHSADLSSTNLSFANLSSANLSFANLVIFQFQQHQAFYTLDGTLRIGCIVMPISEWLLGFEEIGTKYGYNPQQIKAYGNFIKSCAEMFNKSEGVE